MKHLPIIFLTLFTINISIGQELASNNVPIDILKQKKDSVFPESDAVILFDIGNSKFIDTDDGYNIQFTRSKRVKVYTKAGAENAEFSIDYYVDGYGKTEYVKKIEVISYNLENGNKTFTLLDKNSIYDEKINERWRAKKFAIPNVKAGTVYDIKYVLETPFHFNLPDWTFQSFYPTRYSEYTVAMIPFYEYIFDSQQISEFDIKEKKIDDVERQFGNIIDVYGVNRGSGSIFNDVIFKFGLKNVPAYNPDKYISSPTDYIKKIDFQLSKFHSPYTGTKEIITTWPALSKDLSNHDDFGKYIKKAKKESKDILAKLDLKGKSDSEKTKIIVDFFKKFMHWNKFYSFYASEKPKEVIDNRTGNSAEINLLLTALLIEAGINAKPVIISTRNHGKIKSNYPFKHYFNHVLIFIENPGILIDGIDPTLRYNLIPTNSINGVGLIINDEEPRWLTLSNNIPSIDKHIFIIEPINANRLDIQFVNVSSFYVASQTKKTFDNNEDKIKEYAEKNGITEINTIRTKGYDNPDMPYSIIIKGEKEASTINNDLIIKPFLNFPLSENPFKEESRSYPVDFIYPFEQQYISKIKVPEGYEVKFIPEPFELSNNLIGIEIEYIQLANIISINANFNLKQNVYSPEDYPKLKRYFEIMIERFNKEVIISRTTVSEL
ncbi:hypothetical protein OO013_03980 [Mangrovivirga sp. M17]|uniref:DUF3857 domain-containing protein n=1 Tax=Mangrovivirga halotolerans TaxID=2993936 RepID=A0ABT3RNT5_9BACT|nr:hypothetical protein [Mangrovivirga halotolerans]MCX2743008.1 hypothetical protein [Mangrovivirga halotolerans]